MKKLWITLCAAVLVLSGCGTASPKATSSVSPSPSTAVSNETPTPASTPEQTPEPSETPNSPDKLADLSVLSKGIFGFANSTGSKLLAEWGDGGEPPKGNLIAIGDQGRVVTVTYAGSQEETEADNGRQTSQNFDQSRGWLYDVIGGNATDNESYFIIDKTLLNENMLLPLRGAEQQTEPAALKADIEKLKGRKVESVSPLQQIGADQHAYLVVFAREGDDMLASLAFSDGVQWVFHDFPATYDENSTWRVDDGGVIEPEYFSFLLAAATESGFLVGYKWMGAEGENVDFLSIADGKATEIKPGYGRYMSPI
ncbi:hypothetical protein [Paenibacillus sp. NPDC058174]|uniref:hypothetical protein n=1 Tax=Paenibacillus sp. NPDC058174 TaxID=3346366 RepID=UPI0036D8FDDC